MALNHWLVNKSNREIGQYLALQPTTIIIKYSQSIKKYRKSQTDALPLNAAPPASTHTVLLS